MASIVRNDSAEISSVGIASRQNINLRVCLIGPPTVTDFEDPEVAETDAIRLIAEHAPIGVLSLAAVLEQNGTSPGFVDLNRLYYSFLRSEDGLAPGGDFCSYAARELRDIPCDVIGFSSICSSYPLTIRIASELKRARPELLVIFGGPQASVVDVATMETYPFIDYIVRGEAEESFPLLLQAIAGQTALESVPGITYRRGGHIVSKANAPIIGNLDLLPLPAFHLYPEIEKCHYIPLELGRGCPFGCTFCSTNDFFRRRFRLKSPARMIEQMRHVRDTYGISTFDLIHDMFTVDRKRVAEFCDALIATGEEFYWNCSARTDCIDDELIDRMARAGCKGIFFGIETGSERLQKIVKKNLDLVEATGRIKASDRRGITSAVSLITGFPDETISDLRDTVHFFVDSLRFDNAEPQLHILAPLAETPLQSQYRAQLRFDDIISDMSHQGWRQDPIDREMIQQHPDIFPNFYSLPAPGLNRPYLRELRDFLLNGSVRFRWLLVGLHQDSGNVMKAFEAFRDWYAVHEGKGPAAELTESRYYASARFRDEFFEFVQDTHIAQSVRTPRAIRAILDYERIHLLENPPGRNVANPERGNVSDVTQIPRLSDGVSLTQCAADYLRVERCLRRKGDLRRIPKRATDIAVLQREDKCLNIVHLSPLSAQILKLCNGERTINQIASKLKPVGTRVSGIPKVKICIFGIEMLRQQGLITSCGQADLAAQRASA